MKDFMSFFEKDISNYPERFIYGLSDPWERFIARNHPDLYQLDPDTRASIGLSPLELDKPDLREPVVRWYAKKTEPDVTSNQIDICIHRLGDAIDIPEKGYRVDMKGYELFTIIISRFRLDRLRLTIHEHVYTASANAIHTPKILAWIKSRWGEGPDEAAELDPRNAPPVVSSQPLPSPESIDDYMAELGHAKDSPEWWNAYLDWFFAYRARYGRKALTYDKGVKSTAVSETEFRRKIKDWETRTGRERDTR